jgi:hypothetical protein
MTGIELDDLTLRQVLAVVASAGWRGTEEVAHVLG